MNGMTIERLRDSRSNGIARYCDKNSINIRWLISISKINNIAGIGSHNDSKNLTSDLLKT